MKTWVRIAAWVCINPFLWAAAPAEKKPPASDQVLPRALKGALNADAQIVFAARTPGADPHWYANFGYWSEDCNRPMYAPGGGRLLKMQLAAGKVVELLNDPAGTVRDPQVHYDGGKILFSYRKGQTSHFHLYEIDADGRRLRQLTDGPFDDIEPSYLPGGDIVFCSTRARRWVSCWYTQVATLHRCDAEGGNIRTISANIEQDNTPAVMRDGRLLYTRWEYVDRSQVDFHGLWSANPDGTHVQTWFGNMYPGMVAIDAKAIPGSNKVAAIFSWGHGRTEHVGDLRIVSPEPGPDAREAAAPAPGCPNSVRDPFPISESLFLVARKNDILLVDARAGEHQVIYTDKQELHEPSLLAARRREPAIPDRVDYTTASGRVILSDVHLGRNMQGVKPGEIRKLLVLEALPKPVNFSGGPEPLTWLGTFNLERVLGTVPVEADGSAYLEIPANRSIILAALDQNDREVKRMQSFISAMPGETVGCAGCHEQRTQSPAYKTGLLALKRPASAIQPFIGQPEVLDYPRDIQPVWDRHCVGCHNYARPDGRTVLTGDRGPVYSHSYWMLLAGLQIADGRNGYGNRPPRSMGAAASAIMNKIEPGHFGVKLSEREKQLVWMWIESGATYAGTYASLGCGMVGMPLPAIPAPDEAQVKHPAARAMQKRCGGCHVATERAAAEPGKSPLPARLSHLKYEGAPHERVIAPGDPVRWRSTQILMNYTKPENSILLLGPLSRQAGGWGTCAARSGKDVFTSTSDPDYQTLLKQAQSGQAALNKIKRFDMAGFVPHEGYLREMKRYGILPEDFKPGAATDYYALDQAYWKSLWWEPRAR